jgi:hypothetical protein
MRFVSANGTWRLDGIQTDDPSGVQLRHQRTAEQQKETLSEARQGYAAIHSAARQRDKSVTANTAGLNYQKAADWAHYYSTHKVDYTRDDDDCTTFVSMALKHGGWKQKTGWYRSDHVWWYDCDWCIPRHSYTFGGAANWSRFALWSKRTYVLSNVWYMGLADVLQFAHSRHGSPGHTMIVTRFDRHGNPLLSQHGYDASGLPLQLVLDHNPGMPFWAYRT